MKFIIILAFSIFLFSCDSTDFKIDIPSFLDDDIPSFSVKPMENSSVKNIGSNNSYSKTKANSLPEVKPLSDVDLNDVDLDIDLSDIDLDIDLSDLRCIEELKYWNDSPELTGGQSLVGIDYIVSFYANANFYDCNVRQQALEDGLKETLQGDLKVFTAQSIGDIPEDKTRFVSWSENIDKSDIKGKMVNLYLQNDQTRTKTRVDVSYSNGVKTVNAMLEVFFPKVQLQTYTRAFFQEVSDSKGEIVEHNIGGRHYNSEDEVIIGVIASVKKGLGSSIFVTKCNASASSFNDECPFSSPKEYYYNTEGESINQIEAENLGLETVFSNLPEELILNSFYNEPESEYFNPSF